MMRPQQLLALIFALILTLPSCTDGGSEVTDEPAVSVSVTEFVPPDTEEETTLPEETEEDTEPEDEETSQYEVTLADLPPDFILEVSEKLANVYRSCIRTTRTETVINVLGEETRSEINSELKFSYGNAHFTRTDASGIEEFFLIDGYLCYSGKCGKYRLGGYNVESFSELVGQSFPLAAFSGGKKELDGGDIILTYDSMTDAGRAAILAMLGLGEGYSVDFNRASLTVCTDSNGHQKKKEMVIGISVSLNGEEVMTVLLTALTEQSGVGEAITLELPSVSEYTLFPDSETIAFYESVTEDPNSFFEGLKAFEFSEKDEMKIASDSLDIVLTSQTDYAYAESIGASIEQNFDIADGTGKHRVLTHFNRHHGFSQIDGGSIFVDKTINANNLFFTLSRPFENSLLPLSACAELQSAKSGKIVFYLNDEAIVNMSEDILLHAGVFGDVRTVKADTAVLYISHDQSGKVTSFGYTLSARVISDGVEYTVSRSHSVEITSRGSAKVKVIYIEVDEEEEE